MVINEAFNDYRIQTSREAIVFRKSPNSVPVCIFASEFTNEARGIEFSIFLNQQLNQLNYIDLRGIVQVGNKNKPFQFELDKKTINGYERPTYWLDLKVNLVQEDFDQEKQEVKVLIEKFSIKERKSKNTINEQIITSNMISPLKGKSKKQILILSFDGITTEDIKKLADEGNLPNFNNFMNENHWFENAITSSTVTASSAASLITGKSLPEHCIYDYDEDFLSPKLMTLNHELQTIGQLAFENNIPAYGLFAFARWAPQYGYSRGFKKYKAINSGALQNFPWLEESIRTISENKDNSFLFAMHHPGGHPPFRPKLNSKFQDPEYSSYIENLKNVDIFLGSVVDQLKRDGIYDNTMIVFLADHGRSLAKEYSRKLFQFTEERLRIPLIIKKANLESDLSFIGKDTHISAQTTVNELVSSFINDKNFSESDYKKRNVDGISWVCETVDYNKKDFIGLVGYDNEWKYTLYYKVDFSKSQLLDPVDCLRYRLSKDKKAGLPEAIKDKSQLGKVLSSSKYYISKGMEFSKENYPAPIANNISIYNH